MAAHPETGQQREGCRSYPGQGKSSVSNLARQGRPPWVSLGAL